MTHEQSLLSAEEAIKPYLAIFKDCYERTIEEYLNTLESYKKPLFNRTRAAVFQNMIINQIKSAFLEMEGVSIIEKYESISLVINNHISARFKKFNAKGLPSNHQSDRNDRIISQQLSLGFVDFPPIAWVDVGYSMNATGTDFELLKVVCRKNHQILWDLYFHDHKEEGDGFDTGTAPLVPIKPTPKPDGGKPRVTIKKDDEQHKKAN